VPRGLLRKSHSPLGDHTGRFSGAGAGWIGQGG
jgi:hypothetical protein